MTPITITILTPTFNRRHTLPRLYESLKRQQVNTFEWLIIDDGSTDQTEEYIARISAEGNIPIRYLKQKNQGKHIALNTGVNKAKGDWVFIVDSDDFLDIDALQLIEKNIYKNVGYQQCYRRQFTDGRIIGKKIVQDIFIGSATQAGNIYQGDLAYVFETKVLKKFPFPKFPNEKFVPELYIWNKISDEHQIIFFSHSAPYICEYLDDGYTKRFKEHLKKNPFGFLLFYRNQINREKSIIKKIKYIIRSIQCVLYIKR